MPAPTFNIGRDAQCVFIGPFGRVDMNVTDFKWKENTHQVISRPLNGKTRIAHVPDYVSGSFDLDRDSDALERLVSRKHETFHGSGALSTGTLYVYIAERGGGTSTLQFSGVDFRLSDAGSWKQDGTVKQTLEWDASDMQAM